LKDNAKNVAAAVGSSQELVHHCRFFPSVCPMGIWTPHSRSYKIWVWYFSRHV